MANDTRFHISIAECTHNMVVPKLIPIITYSVGLFGSISGNSLRTETIIGHRSVAEAIDAKDAEKAAEAMRQHLMINKNVLEDNWPTSFKGAITENYVLNELIYLNKTPYFWRSGNSAELDFVYEEEGEIFPVEVKSATNTQAKSYKQFCKKYKAKAGYKLSLKNIAYNDCEGVFTISLPLYLQWNMDRIRKSNVNSQ